MHTPVNPVAQADDMRPITGAEKYYYMVQKNLYLDRCRASPCDRKLRAHFNNIVSILETGMIPTYSQGKMIDEA